MGFSMHQPRSKKLAYIIIILSLLFLTPYFILNRYNMPMADDFYFSLQAIEHGFWGNQINMYKILSGRFIATIWLSFNPVVWRKLELFPLYSFVNMVLFFIALGFFVRRVFEFFEIKKYWLPASLMTAVAIVAHLPSTAQAFYWMTGYTNYMMSNTAMLIIAGLYLSGLKAGRFHWGPILAMAVLSFYVTGSNETSMFQLCVFYLVMVVYCFFKKRPWFLPHLVLLLVSGVGGLIVYLAPGNDERSAMLNPQNPIYAAYKSVFGSTLEHTVQFINLPLIFLVLLAIYVVIRWDLKNFDKLARLNSKKLWLIYVLTLAVGYFPSQISMGGNPRLRVDNMFYMFYVFFMVFMGVHYAVKNKQKFQTFFNKYSFLNLRSIVALFFLMSFLWDNSIYAWRDMAKYGPEYGQVWQQRLEVLENSQGKEVVFTSLQHIPRTILFNGVRENPSENKYMAKYFGVESIRITPGPENKAIY